MGKFVVQDGKEYMLFLYGIINGIIYGIRRIMDVQSDGSRRVSFFSRRPIVFIYYTRRINLNHFARLLYLLIIVAICV